MTEGTITKWLKKEGDRVAAEEPLFEMETDKLNIEITSSASGVILKIVRNEGEVVPITETIAIIGEPEEDISSFLAETAIAENMTTGAGKSETDTGNTHTEHRSGKTTGVKATGGRIFATPRAKTAAMEKGIEIEDIDGTGPDGLIIERDVISFTGMIKAVPKATPLAARIAMQNDIGLDRIEGTGARGKVTKADVEAVVAGKMAGTVNTGRSCRLVPFTGMRKAISDRMMLSIHGMAQANHRMKVDMSEAVRFRDKLKVDGAKVSFTDIIIKVAARALSDFPIINSMLTGEGILLKEEVNIGMAVAVENGLIVPVIKNADLLTLGEISAIAIQLAEKARSGKLTPDEYSGGTFTVTNLGMYDIDEFTAIINPPESAILAIGKIDRTPVAEGDEIVIRPIVTLSLTYDHRIIDGAPAAQFLQRVKQLLQNPYLLI